MGNTGERSLAYLTAGGGARRFTTSPTTVTQAIKAIYMCRGCALTSITASDITNETKIGTGTTFAAGTVLQGDISKIKIASGACILIS